MVAGSTPGFVLFGGQTESIFLSDTHLLDANTRVWSRGSLFSIPPSPRSHHAAALADDGYNYHHSLERHINLQIWIYKFITLSTFGKLFRVLSSRI